MSVRMQSDPTQIINDRSGTKTKLCAHVLFSFERTGFSSFFHESGSGGWARRGSTLVYEIRARWGPDSDRVREGL